MVYYNYKWVVSGERYIIITSGWSVVSGIIIIVTSG